MQEIEVVDISKKGRKEKLAIVVTDELIKTVIKRIFYKAGSKLSM
ncbi:hypothetical protein [Enterococcus faecium]|nr:hypothetical protein [Enterococcus faecium]